MKNYKSIKMSVKQTLGCTCPEEVFRYIDCQSNTRLDDEVLSDCKINIGNRLLTHVVETNDPNFVKSNLSTLVCIGKM